MTPKQATWRSIKQNRPDLVPIIKASPEWQRFLAELVETFGAVEVT